MCRLLPQETADMRAEVLHFLKYKGNSSKVKLNELRTSMIFGTAMILLVSITQILVSVSPLTTTNFVIAYNCYRFSYRCVK